MNDFTKEELQYILECVSPDDSALNGGWYREPDVIYRLKEKIQSMIDNYCEHEFSIKSLCPHFLMMCEKCSKTFVDGTFPG